MANDQGKNEYSYCGLTLERNSYACPEQYSVYDGVNLCGWMRLGHGIFIVDCYYDPNGWSSERVYESETEGDGIFYDEEEREYNLKNGAEKIYECQGRRKVMCSNSQGYYGSNNNTPEDVIDDSKTILERIAMISHGGGLIGFADESSALNEIRRLSQPYVGNQVNRAQFLSAPIDNRGYVDLRQVRDRLPKPNNQGKIK
jgi:hypothetical protein